MDMYREAKMIIDAALASALPDNAVRRAIDETDFGGRRVSLIAIGKAAWQMARAAYDRLGGSIVRGIVITKYGHSMGPIGELSIFEAGHPVPDANTYSASAKAVELAEGLTESDALLFLISGGGSALFEKPLVSAGELESITGQLLASGADIVEINIIRKRLSAVKGGKLAQLAAPARVYSVVLSDVLGDPLDAIASGPAYPDSSTRQQAWDIVNKYGLKLSDESKALLDIETPKALDNVETRVTGSVSQLCAAAERTARELGYEPVVLTDMLSCQAREAGAFLSAIAKTHAGSGRSLAYIAGGETVVKLTGKGKGGRNQELALSAAEGISGLRGVVCFSVGSDGTDGPTDAAGGYTDWETAGRLREQGIKISDVLRENDAYHALEKVGGLIITGPTGTNVNDLAVLLIREQR